MHNPSLVVAAKIADVQSLDVGNILSLDASAENAANLVTSYEPSVAPSLQA